MTFREYVLMCRGYDRRRSHEFEHTRSIVYAIAATNRDAKTKFPSMHEFWPLPTDGDEVKEKEEDLNETRRRLVEYYNKTFGKNLA